MRERKNFLAALLLATAFLTVTLPARAEGPARGMRDASPGMAWMVRLLDWLGLQPQGLGSIREASSANIDPNGQPTLNTGGGASASPDDSANIDPNG
jgi:hypothetical protein